MLPRRWSIAILVTAAIAISYLDRQTLPVAVDAVRQDIAISDQAYGWLVSIFLLAYAVMYMGGGKLIDVLGTRRGFFWIMVGWSLACASHGLATGVVFLAVCRFLLGLGEGGGFPAATKAVAEWFPAQERATAMGMINAGTAVGAVLAAPAVAAIIEVANWRWAFVAAGSAGLLWTVWWLYEYFPPAEHPRLSDDERDKLKDVIAHATPASTGGRWLDLLMLPQVLGLVLAKCLSDSAWFFYAQWLPKYLYDVHHFATKDVGYYAWIPYAAAGIGSLIGGAFSSWLVRRGYSLNVARKVALAASAACMPWVFLVTQFPANTAIVIFSIAFFGQQSWSTLVMTLPADIFPRRFVGSVAGLVGFGGAMGGVIFNLIAGSLLQNMGREAGYMLVFGLTSSFHVLAFLVILVSVRRVEAMEM
jgi:ACS family hexuronate transporter-like MFS transporter